MPNYTDDFYYDYTPKSEKEKDDLLTDDLYSTSSDRDISSYSKGEGLGSTAVKPAVKKRATVSATQSRARKPVSAAKYKATGAKAAKAVNSVFDVYGNFCLNGLGNIIKVLAFIIAFGIIIVSLVLAIALFKARTGLSFMSFVTIIGGTVMAAIAFFPIYGIGHIICQNNEILRVFKDN